MNRKPKHITVLLYERGNPITIVTCFEMHKTVRKRNKSDPTTNELGAAAAASQPASSQQQQIPSLIWSQAIWANCLSTMARREPFYRLYK